MLGVSLLLDPLLLAAEIGRLTHDLVAAARHSPVWVAGALILALALDIFLPVPNGVTNMMAGAIFGMVGGTAVIWSGLMAASMLGYGVGRWAAKPVARRLLGEAELARAHDFAQGLGPLVLILARPVPVFAELTVVAAGMAGMSGRLFLMLTALANLFIATVFAAMGTAALADSSGAWAMIGGVLLPLLAWLGYRHWAARPRR